MIGWAAPASTQTAFVFGKPGEWIWSTKTNGQFVFTTQTGGGLSPGELYAPVTSSAGAWTSPYPYMLGISFDPTTGEITYTVNGRYSFSAPLASLSDASSNHIGIGYSADGTAFYFTGAIGHVYIYNRALTVGETAELFRVGYVATPPAFTDIFDDVTTGIPAQGTLALSNTGIYTGDVTAHGSPVVDVKGSTIPKSAFGGYCSICGGRMRVNESQVSHTVGTGAGLGGVGNAQPSHHSCRRIRPSGVPAYTVSSPPTNYKQFTDAYSRLTYDFIRQWVVRNTPNKTRYFHINESALSAAFNGAFVNPSQSLFVRDIFQVAHCAAILQSYHKLPRNSPMRALAELTVDMFINQWQVPNTPAGTSVGQGVQGGGATPLYHYDGSGATIDLAGSAAVNWNLVTGKGAQTSSYGVSDDFFISQFGQILWLLAPYMDKAKVAKWKASFLAMVNWWIGPSSQMTSYTNPNRNLSPLLAIWIAYKISGDPGYLEAFEQQWAFVTTPPTLPSPSTTIASRYPNYWALLQKQWGASVSLTQYNSYPTTTGFGWVQATAANLADGSDGAGYFPEFLGGGTAPYGGTLPAFDGDYSQIQLEHLIELWIWTRDPRFLQYANMSVSYTLPLLDMNGGNIVFKTQSAGSAIGPAAKLSAGIASGVNSIPITGTSGTFTQGATIVVGAGTPNVESLVIATGGVSGSALTTTTNTVNSHNSGDDVGETTATNTFFTGWNLDAQRGGRHNAITQWFNAWPLISWGNGLRQATPFTLAQVQQQWSKVDAFDRLNAIGQSIPNYIPNAQLVALLADPNYVLPGTP
jgi:hypothetical protein